MNPIIPSTRNLFNHLSGKPKPLVVLVRRMTLLLFCSACLSCTDHPSYQGEAKVIGHSETEVLRHPSWSRNNVIYEINVRQHTAEGTLVSLVQDIPRLQKMGVDILWLMPIHPIGELNKKGKRGNVFSVRDYSAVSKEFGSVDDLKNLVSVAHSAGMRVIMDWVGASCARDHSWAKGHKDFFLTDSAGVFLEPPGGDQSDLAVLNWDNHELWTAMHEAMLFWVRDCGIDGFHCEGSTQVPTEFWNSVRLSLDSIRPVLMLADGELREHHLKAFDVSTAEEFSEILSSVAQKKGKLSEIDDYMTRQDTAFPRSAYRLYATTNGHLNSEMGTGEERMGKARMACDVLTFTLAGMPMIYTGEEGGEMNADGSPNRYSAVNKDTVYWNNYQRQDFYARLIKAKHENEALWNGEFGGSFKRISTSSDEEIYAFERTRGKNQVIVILNFSDKPQKIDFLENISGEYKSIFNNQTLSVFTKGDVKLEPWGYQLFVKQG